MSSPLEHLPRSIAVIDRGIHDGLHLGAQVFVQQRGRVVVDAGWGEARPGEPLRPDHITLWLSSGKPITAAAIAQQWQQGRLPLELPVVEFIPEFGGGGKESITVRHLLTHTGGIRSADKCDLGNVWTEIIDCICATPLEPNWVPGQRAGYHPSASWYILGELIRRIDGRPVDQYLREEIFGPCGLSDSSIALSPEQFRAYGERLAPIYHTEKGPPSLHRRWNSESDAAVPRPGRNARGPVRELGRFYEVLRRLRAGQQAPSILRPPTVRELTRRQREAKFDDTFQQVIDWGFGVAIDSKRYGRERVSYGYGPYASDETFGHGGSQSSCGFADPVHELVVAWVFNGLPGERRHQVRAHELNRAIYEDLRLAA